MLVGHARYRTQDGQRMQRGVPLQGERIVGSQLHGAQLAIKGVVEQYSLYGT